LVLLYVMTRLLPVEHRLLGLGDIDRLEAMLYLVASSG
jgi:hypothetical protein